MRSRSLGVLFIAAVIVPSTLLAVLSIRSAGREEAWMEKQMASTLDAEVTHAAGLAGAEVGRIVDELRAGLDVPAGGDYARVFSRWKGATPLVGVPFLLSPRFGILWPRGAGSDDREKQFLKDNGDFLSDRAATSVLQNIAVRYQAEILAEAGTAPGPSAKPADEPARAAEPAGSADRTADTLPRSPSSSESAQQGSSGIESSARQMAIDAFAQSPALQNKVYEEAKEKGDTLSARVVSPKVLANAAPAENAPAAAAAAVPAADADRAAGAAELSAGGAAEDQEARDTKKAMTLAASATARSAQAPAAREAPPPQPLRKQAPSKTVASPAAPQPRQEAAPSQFVVTSQLLSQIASRGESGLIPRFIADRLVFLFWARQKDGRIAGCEVAAAPLRARIAGVLESTWTPVRILTLLDEAGAPLAAPPGTEARDWRHPFVAREISESLPRWEAAAYLTSPDAISAKARSSSLVIWIMVMILFVSVVGGGTMVLSSVYAEMRLAQQKATFVTNVSHELKTPLTSISLFVDLLRRKGPLPQAKRVQYLSLMASETERLTRLINNVLDFSRDKGARRYAMREVDVADVTEQAVEGQRVRLESRGFDVSFAGPAAPARARVDPEALKQVLLNLLSNAEKYSKETKEILVRVVREPTGILLVVSDRGIGVPEKERDKIFREFYRVDDSLASGVQGTGLGLSIARRIARDHGGDVSCAPRRGGGTDFVVRLPASDTEGGNGT